MRLIDADLLKESIAKWLKPSKPDKAEMIDVADACVSTMMTIDEQPTAFDLDKVVEQLEEGKKRAFELCLAINDSTQRLKYIEKEQTIDLAIKIVKGGGVE